MKPLKILLVGDYSNLHSQLQRSLQEMGHEVMLVSEGSGFQDTRRDINARRRLPGKAGGLLLYAQCRWQWHKQTKGYDIVAFQNPHFLPLKPKRLRYFFDRLRGENGKVFLSAAGTDLTYIDEALDPQSPLRYTEFRNGTQLTPFGHESRLWVKEWNKPEMRAYNEYFYDHLDGAVSALYEYHIGIEKRLGKERIAYGGIPVDTRALTPREGILERVFTEPIRIFLGRHRGRYAEKGTDILEAAARRVAERYPTRCSLEIVENRPYAEYIELLTSSHIMLDQIYSYSPATNALIGMSRGMTVVSGGESDYYDFIGEMQMRPIVNAALDVEENAERLAQLIVEPNSIVERSRMSREFAIKHNDAAIVAKRYLDFWTR